MRNLLLTALVGAGLLGGCTIPIQIEGTSWVLKTMNGEEPIPGTTITLTFTADTAGGSGGCNEYSADYVRASEDISFGPIAATLKACGTEIDTQEQTYLTLLQTAASIRQERRELSITAPNGLLRFSPGD